MSCVLNSSLINNHDIFKINCNYYNLLDFVYSFNLMISKFHGTHMSIFLCYTLLNFLLYLSMLFSCDIIPNHYGASTSCFFSNEIFSNKFLI